MNFQQMVMQAQKMQREIAKAKAELAKKEFNVTKGGIVTVKMMGDKKVSSIKIENDAFEKDNQEMIEETIALAINELLTKIEEEDDAIQNRIANQAGGRF